MGCNEINAPFLLLFLSLWRDANNYWTASPPSTVTSMDTDIVIFPFKPSNVGCGGVIDILCNLSRCISVLKVQSGQRGQEIQLKISELESNALQLSFYFRE